MERDGIERVWPSVARKDAAYWSPSDVGSGNSVSATMTQRDPLRDADPNKVRRLEPRVAPRPIAAPSAPVPNVGATPARSEPQSTTAQKHTILVVDDDEDLAQGLEVHLLRDGYKVLRASRGQAGLDLALTGKPDLILLDVNMPGTSGLDVCRELRKQGVTTPIIMLTARSEEIDKVLGLELGADDYVTKPFGVRELVARIRARLRRDPVRPADHQPGYRFEDIEVDFERCRVAKAGQHVDLTPKEFEILRMLIRNRGQIVSRDKLLTDIWGYQVVPNTRTVDNHILKLRQKLEGEPGNPRFILSVYGEGYKFVG